jgi:hypothetical protein
MEKIAKTLLIHESGKPLAKFPLPLELSMVEKQGAYGELNNQFPLIAAPQACNLRFYPLIIKIQL